MTMSEHHNQLVQEIRTFFFLFFFGSGERQEEWKEPLHDWRDYTALMYENTPWQAILEVNGAHIILFFFIVNPQLADI